MHGKVYCYHVKKVIYSDMMTVRVYATSEAEAERLAREKAKAITDWETDTVKYKADLVCKFNGVPEEK